MYWGLYYSDRITSIVSDITRNVFYTLHSNNTISIYTPTPNTQSIQHIQTLSNLFKSASEKAPGSPALTPQNFHIISLHVIHQNESRSGNGVQLMAVTTNGVRLYFSPSSSYGYYSYGSNTTSSSSGGQRPLTLIHVRLPPANLIHPDEQRNTYRPTVAPAYGGAQVAPQPTSRPYIISAIENSCYSEGLLVAAQEGDVADRDFLLCMSPDLTRIGSLGQLHNHPNQQHQPPAQQTSYGAVAYGSGGVNQRPPLTEYATLLAIPGRTWSIASVPHTSLPNSGNSPAPVVTNELATQFVEDPRSFMILTNAGLTFVVKRRALDYLRAAIEDLQKNGTVQPIIECRDRCGCLTNLSFLLHGDIYQLEQLWTRSDLCDAPWSCKRKHIP
jgi:nuclear pore complex protein Nup155